MSAPIILKFMFNSTFCLLFPNYASILSSGLALLAENEFGGQLANRMILSLRVSAMKYGLVLRIYIL